MDLKRISSAEHPMYQRALELYAVSFPAHEQREAVSQERILKDQAYHFCLAYDETSFVGLVLYWETAHYIYIEHLCILPELRSRKYGERILQTLQSANKCVILEIDPPIDPVSQRREGFYKRCGFVKNPHQHVHPAYHRESCGHELVIMTHPQPISREEYDSFFAYLRDHVMDRAFT